MRVSGWVLPTVGYIVLLGAAGVTIKLALRTIEWQQLVLWVPIVYALFAVGLVAFAGTRFPGGVGSAWAAFSAVCAAGALILLFVALTKGDASKVVPITSAYPVITLIGSALFLAERVTTPRVVGMVLVVVGVAVLSR
jgi:transporter family protein